jgi:hypothetical protein
MSFDDFIKKYEGKGIDFDKSYGFQCQDLYRQYVKEVLGFPQSPAVPGAKDNWDKYLPEYYQRIENTPAGVPMPGDIILWGSSYGQWGHVAICIKATSSTLTCFSQNDPTGSLCITKLYRSYKGVIGWLHPLVQSTQEFMQIEKSVFESLVTKSSAYDELAKLGYINPKSIELITNSLEENIRELKAEYDKFVLAIVTKLNPTGSLAPVTDKNYALQLVDEVLNEKDSIQKTLKQKEDEFAKTTKELEAENLRLETELGRLKQEIEDMEVKHTAQIEGLKKRLETVSKSTTALKENKALNRDALSLISKLKKLIGIK